MYYYRLLLLAATQMHASNSTSCSQAVGLCTTVGVGYVHGRLSNTMSMCTTGRVHVPDMSSVITMHDAYSVECPGQGCYALMRLFSRFHLSCCLSCCADGPFKVKGSSLWKAYSSLDSQSLTTAVKVSKSRHN